MEDDRRPGAWSAGDDRLNRFRLIVLCCGAFVAMSTRNVELEQEVVEETVNSLVLVLVSGSESKCQSVINALTGLDVDPSVVIDALLPLLEDTAPTQVACRVITSIIIIKIIIITTTTTTTITTMIMLTSW